MSLAPNDPAALVMRGIMVRGQYGLVAALPWFDRAVAIDSGNVPGLIERAATLGDLGRYREMLRATRAVLAIDPANPRAFYLQAAMMARAGRPETARALLQRAGDRLGDLPGALLLGAALAIETGAPQQATTLLARLLDAQPDNLVARRMLGLACWRQGDLEGTIGALAPLAARDDGYALALTGRAYERLGDRRAAAPYLDRAAAPRATASMLLDPGAPIESVAAEAASRPGDAVAAIRYIRALIGVGDIADATGRADRLARDNPGAPDAHMLVGDLAALSGHWADAVRAFARAANLQFSERVALRLIEAQRRAGDGAGANTTLALFLTQNPRSIPAQLAAGDLLLAAGRWRDAAKLLEPVRRRIGDGDVTLLANLAWAWTNAGDESRGRGLAEAAHAAAPANPAVGDALGWTLFRSGDGKAHGLALIEQAVAMAPGDPGLRWHLAQAYASEGRAGAARQEAALVAGDEDFPFSADARALADAL